MLTVGCTHRPYNLTVTSIWASKCFIGNLSLRTQLRNHSLPEGHRHPEICEGWLYDRTRKSKSQEISLQIFLAFKSFASHLLDAAPSKPYRSEQIVNTPFGRLANSILLITMNCGATLISRWGAEAKTYPKESRGEATDGATPQCEICGENYALTWLVYGPPRHCVASMPYSSGVHCEESKFWEKPVLMFEIVGGRDNNCWQIALRTHQRLRSSVLLLEEYATLCVKEWMASKCNHDLNTIEVICTADSTTDIPKGLVGYSGWHQTSLNLISAKSPRSVHNLLNKIVKAKISFSTHQKPCRVTMNIRYK